MRCTLIVARATSDNQDNEDDDDEDGDDDEDRNRASELSLVRTVPRATTRQLTTDATVETRLEDVGTDRHGRDRHDDGTTNGRTTT